MNPKIRVTIDSETFLNEGTYDLPEDQIPLSQDRGNFVSQGALTEAFRHELRPLGIRVTNVMPGPTWSASWEGVEFPENRLLDAKHIAEAVWQAWQLPPEAVMEELVIRPFEGDID